MLAYLLKANSFDILFLQPIWTHCALDVQLVIQAVSFGTVETPLQPKSVSYNNQCIYCKKKFLFLQIIVLQQALLLLERNIFPSLQFSSTCFLAIFLRKENECFSNIASTLGFRLSSSQLSNVTLDKLFLILYCLGVRSHLI